MLNVKNISVSYRKGELILDDLSFSAGEGNIVVLLGPNGAGKTTLLRSINAILKPQKGVVEFENQNVLKMPAGQIAKIMGYVAQRNNAGNTSVFDAVLLGRKPHVGLKTSPTDFAKVSHILQQLGLESLTMRKINQLSGGELQKVCIARAFVQEPGIFLLDEPTSNLDLKNQLDILHTIRDIVKKNSLTAVITMHNLNLAFRFADKIILLNKGKIFAQGTAESITPEILSQVYGVQVEIISHNGNPVIVPV
ncbi:MAG: ABC transporter ATP-binding protein [Prolixibacteraceae bacterium]|nr:ABC transporter ATP-binding protein [Prolixibacteraceae bacterium]